MAYSYDQIFAADPANPANVAQDASILIFAPGDETMTPLTITTPDGAPLANPVQTNANGFGSAFMHATLDRVAWAGGGFTGFFTSYEGMKQVAVAAQTAAEISAQGASDAAAAATAAAALVDAPADPAIAAAVNGETSQTRAALDARYALDAETTTALAGKVDKSSAVNVRDYGATGDGTTDDRAAIKTAVDAANVAGGTVYFPPGEYFIGGYSTFAAPGATTFSRWAFTVGSGVTIEGAAGATLTENIDNPNRRVMFYLEGSDITIRGLTFRNDYDMAGGSRPTSIPIGAGDSFNTASTTAVKNIRIQDCTFLRAWHPTKFAFHEGTGTATADNITISGCVSRGEPTTTSSGGFNFRTTQPSKINNVTVTACQVYDVTVSAAIGYYGVQDGVITGNVCRGSQIDGAGIQLENGADNITISGNSLTNHFNHIWVDDSTSATIAGNTMRNTTAGANFKGVRITRQGYTEDPNKLTTDVIASGNTLRNCFITAEAFGTPTGTPAFGSLTITDNIIRLDGVTNNRGIVLGGSIAARVAGNRVVGAATESISISPQSNQYLVVEGNITTKAGAEASVGFVLGNVSGYRPIIANNQFINGLTIPQAVSMMVGNVRVYSYTGTPEAAVSGPVGSVFLRSDGGAATTFYVKETGTGSTGWVAK